MDGDVAEQIHAVNGDELQEQQDVEEEQTEQEFYSDEQHVDDSAGDEIKRPIDDDNRDSSSGKLFVGGVAWETTEETFASYFSKYGEITDSVIMIDKLSGRPRGFGFVTFSDAAVADKVIEEEHVIDGRAVEVKRTVPREDMQVKGDLKTRKIFIGGIPPSFTEDELKEYFSSYGNIAEHQIMLDHKTGRSRGFGFVTFEDEDAVEKIFFDGKTHELGGKQVEIKKAEPRRPASDYSKDSRMRHGGGGSSKSYGGFSGGAAGYGGGYGGKMGSRGYGGYGGYGGYSGYGGYGGNYGGGSASFYGGYGGYGQGFGFGGPMYGAAGYGGAGYGSGGYGTPGGYSGAAGYGGGRGYGTGGAGAGAGGVGFGGGGGGGGKGYGSGSGYGGGKGYGNGGGGATGRHHPYRK